MGALNTHQKLIVEIVHEAELERRRLEQDLRYLKEARQSFIDQFRAFCTAQLTTLDNLDRTDRARTAAREAVQPADTGRPTLGPKPKPAPPRDEHLSAPTIEPSRSAPTIEPPRLAPTIEPSGSAPTIEPSRSAPTNEPSRSAPGFDEPRPAQAPPRQAKPWIPEPVDRDKAREDGKLTELPVIEQDEQPVITFPPPLVPEKPAQGDS